jgi:hypothetical protein
MVKMVIQSTERKMYEMVSVLLLLLLLLSPPPNGAAIIAPGGGANNAVELVLHPVLLG